MIGLLEPPGRIARGEVKVAGLRIDNQPPDETRKVRGQKTGAIFQVPLTSLDPRFTVGQQLGKTITTHLHMSQQQARSRAIEPLASTGIPAPQRRIDHYPHQFSGGMRQRIAIARALAVEPRLTICDEPTSALGVSVQAQILNLLAQLQRELGVAYLFITHNFGVVEYLAHEIAVMKEGRIVEAGPPEQVLERPQHLFTQTLLADLPRLAPAA